MTIDNISNPNYTITDGRWITFEITKKALSGTINVSPSGTTYSVTLSSSHGMADGESFSCTAETYSSIIGIYAVASTKASYVLASGEAKLYSFSASGGANLSNYDFSRLNIRINRVLKP